MGVETLIGAGAGLLGSAMQSDAAGDAADAQSAATAASIAEQRRQFDLTRGDYAPYRAIGTNALRRLGAFYDIPDSTPASVGSNLTEAQIRQMLTPQYTTPGTPAGSRTVNPEYDEYIPATQPTVRQAELDAAVQDRLGMQGSAGTAATAPRTYDDELSRPLQMDPGYQFGMQQGQQGLDRKFAAAGGRVSGAALKAATRFNTDYATSGYNSAYQRRQDTLNRLQNLAGIGQTSTNASAAAGQGMANNISGAMQSQGDASGAARLAQGNIWSNALNQAGAAWQRRTQPSYTSWGSTGGPDTMGFGGVY